MKRLILCGAVLTLSACAANPPAYDAGMAGGKAKLDTSDEVFITALGRKNLVTVNGENPALYLSPGAYSVDVAIRDSDYTRDYLADGSVATVFYAEAGQRYLAEKELLSVEEWRPVIRDRATGEDTWPTEERKN